MSRIVIVISDPFLRRLTPSLAATMRLGTEFRIIDIHRPFAQIQSLLQTNNPDGLITEWLPGTTEKLLKLGYPTVIADTDFTYPGAASLDVDDVATGHVAAQYFLDAGYSHFAFVGTDRPYSDQRERGFRDLLTRSGKRCHSYPEKEISNRHYMEIWDAPPTALRDWLRALPKPIGIFAAHDPLGRLICEAGREAGVSIPDEISVLGANNDELVCGLCHPALSSVVLPWDRIGGAVGAAMEALLTGRKAPRHPTLFPPGGVVQRHSTTLLAVEDSSLRRALDYLRKNAVNPITIGAMCHELRVSRRVIEQRFSKYLHATPWEILSRMRVERAKSILLSTDQPISRIAEMCGFGDAERFAVVFRRHVGESPSSFRKGGRTGT